MKAILPDVLILLGVLLVPLGVALVHRPTAIAVLGMECLLLGVLASASAGRR